MKRILVLIKLLLLIVTISGFAQEIVIPKDTIYVKYVPNDGSVPEYRGKKFLNKYGLNFNLYQGEGLIFPNQGYSDTLDLRYLKNYDFIKIKDLDSLGKKWYTKNLPILKRKYGKIIAPHDRNGKFVTFLIEEFNNCIIKYRVYWRNQEIQE
jgi:uncharacterized protein YxeA